MKERMSYLNGLVDGLELSKKSKEGEIIKEITVALEEFAELFDAMDMDLAAVEQRSEAQEERMNMIERDVYGVGYSEETSPAVVDVECPSCSQIVSVEEDIVAGEDSSELFCPTCRNFFVFNGISQEPEADEVDTGNYYTDKDEGRKDIEKDIEKEKEISTKKGEQKI